jgi:hypothetical protein
MFDKLVAGAPEADTKRRIDADPFHDGTAYRSLELVARVTVTGAKQ